MTTAPLLGQPAAPYPAAPRNGRAGLLAVPALVVAGSAVLGVVLSSSAVPRLLFALVGLVHVLTMDQYSLADVEHDPARRAMCRAVLQLGSSLGLPVIVEGVTNPAVFGLLRDMGHRYLQGYVFSRPLEAGQLAGGAWEAWVELPDAVPVHDGRTVAQSAAMPS